MREGTEKRKTTGAFRVRGGGQVQRRNHCGRSDRMALWVGRAHPAQSNARFTTGTWNRSHYHATKDILVPVHIPPFVPSLRGVDGYGDSPNLAAKKERQYREPLEVGL